MKTRFLIATAALALAACTNTMNTTGAADNTGSDVIGVDNAAGPDANLTGADDNLTDNGATASTAPMDAKTFANTAAASDAFEIASAKVAEEQATTADLKAFARKMVTDHTKSTAGLKAAASFKPDPTLSAKQTADLAALKAAKGADFDALYKSQQLAAHQDALSAMQSYAASGDDAKIKAFAASTAPVVQSHIDMLQKM